VGNSQQVIWMYDGMSVGDSRRLAADHEGPQLLSCLYGR
jgi:hypothetical protein